MKYDPIKDRLGALVERHPLLHRLFFALLDTLFLRAWYVQREVRRLMRSFGRGQTVRVLDAGTGFGQYAHFVARTFPNSRVVAVDIKRDYLARAERFFEKVSLGNRVEFAYQDLTRLDVDGPFDLILSVDVMEHIEQDEAVLRHFAGVLRPGGYVLINTPSDHGGSAVEDAGDESFIGEHVREGYARAELESRLRRAGLEPVRSMYTYGRYGSRAWELLIQRPMQMLDMGWRMLPLIALYYVAVLPAGLWLNAQDMAEPNETGTGLLIVAQKPVDPDAPIER